MGLNPNNIDKYNYVTVQLLSIMSFCMYDQLQTKRLTKIAYVRDAVGTGRREANLTKLDRDS